MISPQRLKLNWGAFSEPLDAWRCSHGDEFEALLKKQHDLPLIVAVHFAH